MTPDYLLGIRLASAPDHILQATLAERPVTLALLRHLNQIVQSPNRSGELDAFLNPVSKPNPNEKRLVTIVAPPGTIRNHRRVTRRRLRYPTQMRKRTSSEAALSHKICLRKINAITFRYACS
jgi:hypothetical protein